jgi:hypothetical protein
MLRRLTLVKNHIFAFSSMKQPQSDPTIFDKILSK